MCEELANINFVGLERLRKRGFRSYAVTDRKRENRPYAATERHGISSRVKTVKLTVNNRVGKKKRSLLNPSFVDQKLVSSGGNCVQITWKRIFEHAFFGTPANFCTRTQTLEQLKEQPFGIFHHG